MTDNSTPPQVPDYDLIRQIGEGGFGRVWLATNQTTGHLRAIKLIPLLKMGASDAAGREIVSLTRLEANRGCRHQNLLSIHHIGKTAEYLFYVMDLADDVSGLTVSDDQNYQAATLQKRLESGPLPADECLSCARQLLSGLVSLHKSGMVHRDVKPANCVFVGGELKLADFSLLTEANPLASRVGTQQYMPPDGRMDTRADVYAAGLVIYEMVTGLPVDRFPSLGESATIIVSDPGLSGLIRAALRACEPDARQRYRDAREMLDDLEQSGQRALSHRSRMKWAAATLFICIAVFLLNCLLMLINHPPRTHVNFITHPFEATIFLDGELQTDERGVAYRTPCTIDNLPANIFRITFKHEQLPDLEAGKRDFSKDRRIEVGWEDIAR